jgi:hypothetical protein
VGGVDVDHPPGVARENTGREAMTSRQEECRGRRRPAAQRTFRFDSPGVVPSRSLAAASTAFLRYSHYSNRT